MKKYPKMICSSLVYTPTFHHSDFVSFIESYDICNGTTIGQLVLPSSDRNYIKFFDAVDVIEQVKVKTFAFEPLYVDFANAIVSSKLEPTILQELLRAELHL